mmetsp:Transcript_35547/g.114444  ORF Transcript_35547/g.114444 Transcript_35547/m.114444 type:complete len:215 (-) Transcript_35547:147-791(-)
MLTLTGKDGSIGGLAVMVMLDAPSREVHTNFNARTRTPLRKAAAAVTPRMSQNSPFLHMMPDTCFSQVTVHISTLRERCLSSSRCTSIPRSVWVCVQATSESGGTMYGGTPCSTANRRAWASGLSAASSSSSGLIRLRSLCCCSRELSSVPRTAAGLACVGRDAVAELGSRASTWPAVGLRWLTAEGISSLVHNISFFIDDVDDARLPSSFFFR